MQNEKCRGVTHAPGAWHSPLPAPRSPLRRRGVTLVELLITILIISILAGLILGVAALAGETARDAQSRHVVLRLHTLLMEHYGTYKTRRVRLNPAVEQSVQSALMNSSKKGQALAEARLYALREMILMEVPDRWSDVLLDMVGPPNNSTASPNPTESYPLYMIGRTDLSNVYLRRYKSLIGRTNSITGDPNTADEVKRNQGAECLYMVITLACGEGEARSLFGENSIGDSDGDGAPEFHDGWDRPINFLRWAPGFDSLIQLNINSLSNTSVMTTAEANAAVAKDHDPFDMFRVESGAYRLVPLIYSPGPDEDSGLNAAPDYAAWITKGVAVEAKPSAPYLKPVLTPYELPANDPQNPLDGYLGTDISLTNSSLDRTFTDNIHNHLLGQR